MKYSSTFSLNKKLLPLTLASVFVLAACGEEATSTSGEDFNSDKDTNTGFDQGKLIASIVDNVITPTYQEFSNLASTQRQAINNYCQQESAFADNNSNEQLVSEAKVLAKKITTTFKLSSEQLSSQVSVIRPYLDPRTAYMTYC